MSAGGKGSEPEPVWGLVGIAALIFFMLWGIWHLFKVEILEAARWIRYVEIFPLSLFSDRYGACLSWLHHAPRMGSDVAPSWGVVQSATQCFTPGYINSLSPQQAFGYYTLTPISLAGIEIIVAHYYHWPIVAVFVAVAVYAFYYSPRVRFKNKYDLESFIKTQAMTWPVISPIVNFNPIKSSARILGGKLPDKLPLFAEALAPEEWISWHRIPVTNNIPEREATRRAFMLQLGPRWNGVEQTPPYFQGLFAAFALKGVQKREESDALLGRLAQCWSAKKGFKLTSEVAAEVRSIIRDPNIGGRATEIADQHAYRATALLGVLRWARMMGGVLAPAQFLWLRGEDRNLWYPMNNLGRRSFHTEGAGAMAHFMAEQSAKKALPIPRIDTAIVTLNQYMAEHSPGIPPREGGDQKKRT